MIVRKADDLNPWEKEKAMAGYYGPNSVVWYQRDEASQGFAYRAKSTYVNSETPPDESDKWEKDYSFYLPWKSGSKYEIGMRVYFFNGQRLYGYKASKRYFGGNGEPNMEVDEDGVRTWELDFQYDVYDYFFGGEFPTEFLFPVKKRNGYIDGKVNAISHTDPEERPTVVEVEIFPNQFEYLYSYLVSYLTEEGLLSKDYREYNSKYQSYAYDDDTYVFYKLTNGGRDSEHRKSGLHRAKFLKELNPVDPLFTHAESQFFHTFRSRSTVGFIDNYFHPHGFSIEMWPNASEDDYELIPSYGFKSFGINSLTAGLGSGNNTLPRVTGGIRFNDPYFYFNSGVGLTGGMGQPAPDGKDYPPTPDEELKFDAYFGRNCPAFDGRVMTINLLKAEEYYQWVDKGYWTSDCYECPWYWETVWVLERIGYEDEDYRPTYNFIQDSIDSYESSYKWGSENNEFLSNIGKVRDKDENPIDFSQYKAFLTTTYISWFGSKWE